jgi:hypothetical protein
MEDSTTTRTAEDEAEPTLHCPVCHAPVAPGENTCSRCGFKLIGKTQEFSIPGSGPSDDQVAPKCGKPHLTIIKGPLEGETFSLEPLPVTIGRDPECDLFLNNMTVSREHAIIERHADKMIIRDNGSTNGTWVDGSVVDEAELNEGSRVQIGTFAMRFSCE